MSEEVILSGGVGLIIGTALGAMIASLCKVASTPADPCASCDVNKPDADRRACFDCRRPVG